MDLLDILSRTELFRGLSTQELEAVAGICRERICQEGEVIVRQGEVGDEMYLVSEGFVEVSVAPASPDAASRAVVRLGRGQLVGEMSLVDRGPRSATVTAAADNTILQAISGPDLTRLCEQDYRLGYAVMRNMSADLSFKLRHGHLAGR